MVKSPAGGSEYTKALSPSIRRPVVAIGACAIILDGTVLVGVVTGWWSVMEVLAWIGEGLTAIALGILVWGFWPWISPLKRRLDRLQSGRRNK